MTGISSAERGAQLPLFRLFVWISSRALMWALMLVFSACTKDGGQTLTSSAAAPIFLAKNGGATPTGATSPARTSSIPKRSFRFRVSGEPETLDWNLAHTNIETHLLNNLMEGLLTFDQQNRVSPALAESWAISNNGTVYTFKLRKGLKWSDGQPLTSADFVYSWKRLLSPVTAASYAYLLFDVVGAEEFNSSKIRDFSKVGVKALGPKTLQVTLKSPIGHWIYIPTFWVTFPLREDVVKKHGAAWPKPGRMVTAGPYTLQSYDLGSKIVMAKNPHYYGTCGNVDELQALIVQDDSTALKLYEAGQIDFLVDIATIDLKRLQSHPDMKTFSYHKVGYLGFTSNKYPMSNKKVRRAISMAIDRSKLGAVLYGGQKTAQSFVPPGLPGHSTQIGLPFDPAKARQELASSGFNPKRKLQVEFLTPNWDRPLVISQYIQGELKKNLGLNISIQPFDHKTFRSQLDLNFYPFWLLSWGADYPDADNFLSVFLSRSGNNKTTWKNKKFDQLIMTARSEMDPIRKGKLYEQAQRILQEEEAVILPLYYGNNQALIKPTVKGLRLTPLNYLLLREVNVGK